MKIAITIQVSEKKEIFNSLFPEWRKISVDIAYHKYGFDLLKSAPEMLFEYLVQEVMLEERNILIGNACNKLDDLLFINKLLEQYRLKINSVVLIANSKILKLKSEALTNTRLHSRWIGGSEEEAEQNFAKLMNDLQAIKDAAPQLGYEVIEV